MHWEWWQMSIAYRLRMQMLAFSFCLLDATPWQIHTYTSFLLHTYITATTDFHNNIYKVCKNNWTHLCCLLYFSSAFQKQCKLCILPLHHTSSHHFEIQHLNNITFKYELLNSHPTPNNSINWSIYGLLSTSSGFVCILLRYFVLWILSLSILVLMTAEPPLVLGSVVLFKSQPCFHGFLFVLFCHLI